MLADSGSRQWVFAKMGECGPPLHGKKWAKHYPFAGCRVIFETNILHRQAQNQEWAVLGLAKLLAK
jgi:hypothetical protein